MGKKGTDIARAMSNYARGGKVGMPHINVRAGIKKAPKIATVKSRTPTPAPPQGIAMSDMPAPAPEQRLSGYAKGGKVKSFEGSAKDESQDKKLAAKYGMSMKEWEASKMDAKHDKQQSMQGLAKGGEAKKWIQGAIKHPGALHKQLGVPKGEKIPAKKLAAASQKGGKLGQRARLAMTLSKMHHAKGGAVKKGAC